VLTAPVEGHVAINTPNGHKHAQPSRIGFAAATRSRAVELCWYAAALLVVIIAGLIRVEMPLNGDQALFLAYARRFDEGLRLYVNLWDVKPPAVFAFYYLGGSLFGFTDRGIHLFELLWMVVLAIAMILGLRRNLRQPWLAQSRRSLSARTTDPAPSRSRHKSRASSICRCSSPYLGWRRPGGRQQAVPDMLGLPEWLQR
jgi:hypothetical protein